MKATTTPKFIKVHDLADPETTYTINTASIEYYCKMHTPNMMSSYTFLKLNGDVSVKITESVDDLDAELLAVNLGEEVH